MKRFKSDKAHFASYSRPNTIRLRRQHLGEKSSAIMRMQAPD